MPSLTVKAGLDAVRRRQRRRNRLRRIGRWIMAARPRLGIGAAYQGIRAWLDQDLRLP